MAGRLRKSVALIGIRRTSDAEITSRKETYNKNIQFEYLSNDENESDPGSSDSFDLNESVNSESSDDTDKLDILQNDDDIFTKNDFNKDKLFRKHEKMMNIKQSDFEDALFLTECSDDEISISDFDFKEPCFLHIKTSVTLHNPAINDRTVHRFYTDENKKTLSNKNLDELGDDKRAEISLPDSADMDRFGEMRKKENDQDSADHRARELRADGEVSGRIAIQHEVKLRSSELLISKEPSLKPSKTISKEISSNEALNQKVKDIKEEKKMTERNSYTPHIRKGEYLHCNGIDDLDPSEIILSKVSTFSSPSCSEIKIFEEYIIMLEGDNLKKLHRQNFSVLKAVKMSDVRRMCKIHNHSVGIIRINECISIVECETLQTKYNILTTKPYADICRTTSFVGAPKPLPDPNYVFAVGYTDTSYGVEDKIHIVRATKKRIQNIIPQYEGNVLSLKLKRANFRGISAIASFTPNKLIVGFSHDVECIQFNMESSKTEVIWILSFKKSVTDISCSMKFVFLCIKDEERLGLFCPENGKEISRNILPSDTKMKPDRFSIHCDAILIKEFSYYDWRNVSTDLKIFRLSNQLRRT